ncbi:MAG: TonB-dependent receptor [Chitinophagales bacterium]|nr:TonB-dependent receptor [Chitinophagales bacterium]
MRKLYVLAGFFSLFLSVANAQRVTGNVKDDQGKAVSKSTVSLLNARDSSVAKLAATDNDGKYVFIAEPGSYLVSVSHIGYAPAYSAVFEVSGPVTVSEIKLEKAAESLSGVTVSSKKPMIEVKADKMIVNVEGTINAVGNDALELLRKSPGVMIDKDDNISLAGKNGVQVYIDGKPSPLSGSDLSNFLKSMQSSQVESIEIITNPSAKYEAAGNAGIINIRLKKNKTFGTNGSVNLGYVQGIYPKYNGGINLNHRNKKINLFGSYNYNNGDYLMKMRSTSERFDTLFETNNRINANINSHSFKGGMDYFVNKNSTLGAVVTGNIADNKITTAGPMYFTYQPTNQLVKILRATNDNDRGSDNVNTNLNYRYAKPGGTELNIDADYGTFKITSDQYQPNYYYLGDGVTETSRVIYNMISNTDIDLYSLKADYEQNYKGGRLGIGGKIGFVNTDNDFKRYDVFTSGNKYDSSKSNRFKYEENINALYVNYNKQVKPGFLVQLGVRMENTNITGTSNGFREENGVFVTYDSVFNRHYTDFFPSASMTFNKNPMNQWTFSYSRRIDRPAYQDLNPFEFKLSEYAYMKGNTDLRPQYTNSFGVTNVYKFRLTTSLNYSHVKDIFAQLPDTIDKTKGFLTKKNLATQDIVALNISYPFQYKRYSFFANLNANFSHYQADFGGGDRKVDQNIFALVYYMQNSFNLGKDWTAELTGLYISPSVWQGVVRSDAMGSVDIGVQKVLFNKKLNLKVAYSDIFKTMKWGGSTNFTGGNARFNGHGELGQIKINLSYRFGNSQVKASRQRKTGLEEETKRANSNGNQQGGMGNK